MELKKEKYKTINVSYHVDGKGLFYCSVDGLGSADKNLSTGEGWPTLSEAERAIKGKVDKFLNKTPKNYTELAKAVEGSLVWTGYEDCYVDPRLLQILVENFNKYNSLSNREELNYVL